MAQKIDFKDLVKAGVHFGHQTSRWCPKMQPYIWGHKNKVHLIDVSKTAHQMEKAAKFLESVAAEGKTILWVGTKKSAQEIIASIANSLNMPFVNHRWIGGTLSNHSQVKKSVTKLLHYEDVIAKAENFPLYTKKEFNVFQKNADRLTKNVGGIRSFHWPVGAIVLVDVTKERSALREAAAMGIPVVALVDTNGDPSLVNYVIPGNDDAPRAIKVVLDYLAQAVQGGKASATSQGKEKVAVRRPEVVTPEISEEVALVLTTTEEEEVSEKRNAATADEGKKKALKKPAMFEESEEDKVLKAKNDKAKSTPKSSDRIRE